MRAADPAVVVMRAADAAALPVGHPAYGKAAPGGPVAYVCRRSVCGLPIGDAGALADALRARG